MPSLNQQRTQKYLLARQQHPAWLLLASRRAPLMLSCLEALFEHQRDGVPFDTAVQAVADMLAAHANHTDFEIDTQDVPAQARRELREWIRRALVTEREGRIHETDALKTAMRFVAQLDHRMMSSTASRLAVVQREIDNLAASLNPDPASRTAHLQRRLSLWRGMPPQDVATAAHAALQLEPGCAEGRPLRALAVAGNDSKFFERHASLVTALLDERFDGEATRQGLAAFLGAARTGEHWLLVVPLESGLLPFQRQRVTATELLTTALPAGRILLVENERCLHQLTTPMPDTIAILGAGLNLGWLRAPWLQSRQVAYWGDIDTWGLAMLATARSHLAHLQALLMDSECFEAHRHLAVVEPVHAAVAPGGVLLPGEVALDQRLRSLDKGRLEQEFLPVNVVKNAMQHWLRHGKHP